MGFNDQLIVKAVVVTILSMSIGLYGSLFLRRRYKYNKEFNRLRILRESRIREKAENFCKLKINLSERKMTETRVSNIIDKSIDELLQIVKDNKQGSDEILLAYQIKAMDVQSKLNCLVEFVHIDKSEININGPLYGLPVSVKDNFLIKGYKSCAGCSYFLDKPYNTNSVLIEVLKDLGAVPFVKTIVPQTMMSILSSNPIDGTALNPANKAMTPGGSSSGEAALVGARGSIVGIGTDIGGSVRLPASFCGVVGFKPTAGRLSRKNLLELVQYSIVTGSCGILGRDVATVACLFKHIVNSKLHRKLDPTVVPMNFVTENYESKDKLKIGYFTFDGNYHVVPAIKRAVLETVKGLQKQGYEVIEWKPPVSAEKSLSLFLAAIVSNKGKDITQICEFDELNFSIKNLVKILNLNIFQYFYNIAVCKLFGYKDFNIWIQATRSLQTSTDFKKLQSDISFIRERFLESMSRHDIDILICPTSGFVALPIRPKGSLTGMLSYQNIWNLIDFPAGTVPVSSVTEADIMEMVETYPKTTSMWHNSTFENQKESLHLPVSVQCVCKPWKEEICLRIMKEIESNLKDF